MQRTPASVSGRRLRRDQFRRVRCEPGETWQPQRHDRRLRVGDTRAGRPRRGPATGRARGRCRDRRRRRPRRAKARVGVAGEAGALVGDVDGEPRPLARGRSVTAPAPWRAAFSSSTSRISPTTARRRARPQRGRARATRSGRAVGGQRRRASAPRRSSSSRRGRSPPRARARRGPRRAACRSWPGGGRPGPGRRQLGRRSPRSSSASSSIRSAASGVRSWCEASALNARSRATSVVRAARRWRRARRHRVDLGHPAARRPHGEVAVAEPARRRRRAARAAARAGGRARARRAPRRPRRPAPPSRRAAATPGASGGDRGVAALRRARAPATRSLASSGTAAMSRPPAGAVGGAPVRSAVAHERVGRAGPAPGDPPPVEVVDGERGAARGQLDRVAGRRVDVDLARGGAGVALEAQQLLAAVAALQRERQRHARRASTATAATPAMARTSRRLMAPRSGSRRRAAW